MSSNTEELGEHCINVFLEDKCFCARWFYRASPRQFKCFYFGLTIFVMCSLVAIVLILDKMGNKESLIYVLIILGTLSYSAISLYTWTEFQAKEEHFKNFINNLSRGAKTQPSIGLDEEYDEPSMDLDEEYDEPPMDLDEEYDEVFSSLEEADLQEERTASREDRSSPPEDGEQLMIPIVGDGVGKNVAQNFASVCVHKPPVSTGESSSSAEISGRVPDSAANSERRDDSDEEYL